jgi:transcriptional regulator with XRE-family HTH domain
MPRRISADIDMQILADVALGHRHKDIAVKYGVSPSYVSKVASGKKVPDVHIPDLQKILNENLEALDDDINAVTEFITRKKILANKEDIIKFLELQITKAILRAKVYSTLLEICKKEEE